MERKNAMERRLDWLHDQWVEFAQAPEARVLRWVVEPGEGRMVEAWLRKEGAERSGECPDLLLSFDTPFEKPEAKEALEHYREAEGAAVEAEAEGEMQGAELRLKSRMAVGASLVTTQAAGGQAA